MLKYFISLLVFISFSAQAKEELFIYNWSDYIAEDTIENFENEFGIAVDLMGFTTNNRFGAFLERCAPIQVNYFKSLKFKTMI